ncbi:protein of unknown function DUF302 [Candidatus Koribacter versatilis Ellin345]|uniref:DUF302 domain-containing protein n=1 Tax=Koribacter versatilis (strain Ellin345) TaxID=204669 RepID=Q1IQM6_KORVE|nr:DUF302 domain-containing protein [Candidatus Koribacter versatilis]ABF40824.1 protein of unknown function DUF302 [Candidatus Koribacter versatilis Ellin345]
MSSLPSNGMIHFPSARSATETVSRIQTALKDKGLTIFAVIDHSGEAARVGLQMHFAQVIIFGSPKAGTPLMVAAPTLALDLPLKALVWEDADGKVWVSYNDPDYLRERHGVPKGLIANLAGAGMLLQKAVQ